MIPRRLFLVLLLLPLALFATAPARGNGSCILVLGDSISAGLGVPSGAGWVDLLRQSVDGCDVVNASISGETTEGGKARLPALLEQHRPAIVVIELGGNDGLRGFPLQVTRANLLAMIDAARGRAARVLLLGMRIPPNYGPRYADAFHALFAELAAETGSALVPFLLEGIATNPALMQQDGIHPATEAQALIRDNVLPAVKPLIRD